MSNKEVWIIAEQRQGKVSPISYELLNRGKDLAQKLKSPLCACVLGHNITGEDIDELIYRGADKVYIADHPGLKDFLIEPYSKVILSMIEEEEPEIVLAAATTTGRTLMPYVAVKRRTGLTADCTLLDIEEGTGNLLQTRPAIGGNILATIKTPNQRPQMATVRPHSMKPAEADRSRTGTVVKKQFLQGYFASRIRKLEYMADETLAVAIQDSKVVVSGGRGVGKAENFGMIDELAELLKGAVGASRDVVDRGWISYPHQVGLSGKTVTPAVYIALGISGAVQHIAGMQTSEHVIAVNKDPDAGIFKFSDFGIVGDLNEVIPKLIEKIREYKSTKEAEPID